MPGSRRRLIDISGIVIFVLIMAILFWPSRGDENDVESAPDGVAEHLLTPTPDLDDTLTPTPEPDDPDPAACVTGNSAQILSRFIVRFNDGNFDALAGFLPEMAPESPTTAIFPGMDRDRLHSFSIHGSGLLADREDILAYLSQRHEAGEHWRVEDFVVERLYRNINDDAPNLDRATVTIHRTADDLPPHQIEGTAVINCLEGSILLWQFATDEPDLALPLVIDDFLSAVGPYGNAEMRDLRMIVSTDLRSDGGGLSEWDIRRLEANSSSGNYVEHVTVNTLDDETLIDYVYDGERMYLEQRGWREVGDMTGWGVLPFEIMLTRDEPSLTARLLREHRDEIPEEGSYQIQGEFEVRDELLEAYSRHPDVGEVDAFVVVEIEDNAVVRTRYRLVSPATGLHFDAPEIRWISMIRADRYEPGLFARPGDFDPDAQQYQIPGSMANNLTLVERLEHTEGVGEVYELLWDGQVFELRVMPSRGGVDHLAGGDDWDPTWRPTRTVYDDLHVVAAESGSAIFPTDAVWDNGRYRFELTIDPEQVTNPDEWNTDDLREIVDALNE